MIAVLYRWKLIPGSETIFQSAWSEIASSVSREYGALGSRLHRTEDGIWVAYSQWPDRACWRGFWDAPVAALRQRMKDCVASSFEPLVMDIVEDRLLA